MTSTDATEREFQAPSTFSRALTGRIIRAIEPFTRPDEDVIFRVIVGAIRDRDIAHAYWLRMRWLRMRSDPGPENALVDAPFATAITTLIREAVDEEAQSVPEAATYAASAVRHRLRELGERILREILSRRWLDAIRPGADDMAPAELRDNLPQHPLYPPALRNAVKLVLRHTGGLEGDLERLLADVQRVTAANVTVGERIAEELGYVDWTKSQLAELGYAARKAIYAETEVAL